MRILIVGSAIACSLGLLGGANLKPGLHADGPDLRAAADSLVQWAAPEAEAAEIAPDSGQILYVLEDGRWVSEVQREADRTQQGNEAAAAAAQAQELASLDPSADIPPPIDVPITQTPAHAGPDLAAQPGAPSAAPDSRPNLSP